jgi:hypothetical protein
MAKLATQHIIITISKAVDDGSDDTLSVFDADALSQLLEAATLLAGDSGVIVEVTEG